jgi:hypothetical protein
MRSWITRAGLIAGILAATGCSSTQSASLTPADPAPARSTLSTTADPNSLSAIPISLSAFPVSLSAFPISLSAYPASVPQGCTLVTDSVGNQLSAARIGGGDHINVDRSATPCDVGIFIAAHDGPAKLDHTVVTGPFTIGVYIDKVKGAEVDHTSICVNGANRDGTCVAGAGQNAGIGLEARETPDLKIKNDHLNIAGYQDDFVRQ